MNEELLQHDDTTIAQKFQYEIEKEAAGKAITFEYSDAEDEHLRVEFSDGMPVLIANHAGMLALAKLLLKLGSRHRSGGFELHLREDFNSDRKQVLCVRIEEEGAGSIAPKTGTASEERGPELPTAAASETEAVPERLAS